MNNYQKVLDVLSASRDQVLELLDQPDDHYHRLYFETHFNRTINHFGSLTGTGAGVKAAEELPPAITIGGAPIPKAAPVTVDDLQPAADAVEVLRGKVQEAYGNFLQMTPETILSTVEPMVIRGVAKKAGLKVTSEEPKQLTKKFVEEVKTTIRKVQADFSKRLAEAEKAVREAKTDEARAAAEKALEDLKSRQP